MAPQSMGFSRQEYWSGLPLPSSGDLPDPGIEPVVEPASLGFLGELFTAEPTGKPLYPRRWGGAGESRSLLPLQDALQVSKWVWLGSFRSLLLPCVSEHVISCVCSLEWSVYILQPSGSPGIQLHWPSKQNVLTCLPHARSWTGEPGVEQILYNYNHPPIYASPTQEYVFWL